MYASFHTVGLPQRSLDDVIHAVSKAGYAAIELNAETLPWARPHITPETPKAERSAFRQAIAAEGLKISAVGGHVPMLFDEAAKRREAIEFVFGCNDLADDMGTHYVHILSGPLKGSATRQQGWNWFVDAVAQTTEHAAERGIALGIEAIAGHLFCRADDYEQLAKDLPGVPFKVNFDPSQIIVQGYEPREIIDRFADRIAHVHMKDGAGLYPDFTFPPLGEGRIDFQRLVERLREVGYDGALSVEYEAQVFGFQQSDQLILDGSRQFLAQLDV